VTTRLALLSPYSGKNFGDQAIHEALIESLRLRFPPVEFVGLNLDPARTSRIHGIPCRPINPLIKSANASRAPETPARANAPTRGVDRPAPASVLKRIAKRVPGLVTAVQACRVIARVVVGEVRGARSSYETMKSVDALIIAGGGQIDEEWGGPWGHPYALFRWALIARFARRPVVFVSIGASSLSSALSRFFVRFALRCSAYRSYRDHDSKRLMTQWSFTRRDGVRPDLAFGLRTDSYGATTPAAKSIAVCPMIYGHPAHWPTGRPEIYSTYIRELAGLVCMLARESYSIRITISCDSDRAAVDDLLSAVRQSPHGASLVDGLRVACVSGLNALLDELSRVECVIASRLHGVILSHLLAKPVLAISFAPKVDTHMREIGQEAYLTSIETARAPQLRELFRELESRREGVHSALEARVQSMRHELAEQCDALVPLFARDRLAPVDGPLPALEDRSGR
jgi:polysaccharide pyruvyl transferase WcaK-like protein